MATCEADFQKELLAEFRDKQIRAFHIAERFKSGVLDLYVRRPRCAMWIELKFIRSAGQQINLSPLQRKFIKDEQNAGGVAGWAVCLEETRSRMWSLYCGTNPEATHININANYVQTRQTGEKWDVTALMDSLERGCFALRGGLT